MKKSNDFLIIYDDACPMCKAYTKAFTELGVISDRCGFSEVADETLALLDKDKAKSEIPLLDRSTGQLFYGPAALMILIGKKLPVLRPLFKSSVFIWLVSHLYAFVSYNRRIMAGSSPSHGKFDCAPPVQPIYRWLYIFVCQFLGLVFWNYAGLAFPSFILVAFILGSSLVHFHQLDYLGHTFTAFLLSGIAALFIALIVPVSLTFSVSILIFFLLFQHRFYVIQKTYPHSKGFAPAYFFSRWLLEIAKWVLRIGATTYSKKNVPSWLSVPFSQEELIGPNFYKKWATEHGWVMGKENEEGLCNLSDFKTQDFNPSKVHHRIHAFYKNTHLSHFSVEQKWMGILGWLLKHVTNAHNQVVQQFNFSGLALHQSVVIQNRLNTLTKGNTSMKSWVRCTADESQTMFAGFYQVDKLPYSESETCVTTRFPLYKACLMVKLKPCNEPDGGFSFRSFDDDIGGYSFYFLEESKAKVHVSTLPVREKICISVRCEKAEVEHTFSFFTIPFMTLHYKIFV